MSKPFSVIQVLPALNSGGVERGALEIGAYLAKHGHKSMVVSAGGRMVEQLVQEGSEHISADIGAKKLTTLKYVPWFRNLILTRKPDIIHLRSRLPAWICYLAWKSLPQNLRPKLVTTFHGQHSVNSYSAIMTCGEKIITVSEMMRSYILSSYPEVNPDKIRVIYRGVDTDLYNPGFKPNPQWLTNWYAEFPQTRDKVVLTLPGRLSKRKGIWDFIQIMEKLIETGQPVHGLVVGETHPKQRRYLNELLELITRYSLDNDITFTGHRSDLQSIIAISNIILNLSTIPEAFGRTATEALSMGKPVIGYNHGGIAEQLDALFPEGKVALSDINQAVAAIHKVISNPSIKIQPNHLFTLENMCSKTLKVYEELLAAPC